MENEARFPEEPHRRRIKSRAPPPSSLRATSTVGSSTPAHHTNGRESVTQGGHPYGEERGSADTSPHGGWEGESVVISKSTHTH